MPHSVWFETSRPVDSLKSNYSFRAAVRPGAAWFSMGMLFGLSYASLRARHRLQPTDEEQLTARWIMSSVTLPITRTRLSPIQLSAPNSPHSTMPPGTHEPEPRLPNGTGKSKIRLSSNLSAARQGGVRFPLDRWLRADSRPERSQQLALPRGLPREERWSTAARTETVGKWRTVRDSNGGEMADGRRSRMARST